MLPTGLELRLRVTPRGGRDALDGIETLSDGRAVLKVRVRAAPSEGEASEVLRRLLAERLDRPASAVTLAAGASARLKTLLVAGDGAALARKLEDLVRSTA